MTIPNEAKITGELIAAHGLKPDEYQRILDLIGREPSFTELGIFSAMWNEHCSYKSSKKWLRTLPTKGPRVIQGPGENAGVVDIGDGDCVVFKMESHNHPSYIEPYQGAATGVGGILRDVFTMGARPIAAMNALRFGAPDHPKTRHLVAGVVVGRRRLRQCLRRADGRRRGQFRRALQRQHPGQRLCRRPRQDRRDLPLGSQGRRPAGRLSRRQDRPRRRRRRDHGVGRIRRQDRGEAPDRAGRRPLHRKMPARGLPRTDGVGRGHRHPGHGRGRPHLLGRRDGRQGRPRHRARPRQGAGARGAHDAPTR